MDTFELNVNNKKCDSYDLVSPDEAFHDTAVVPFQVAVVVVVDF